MKFMKLSGAEQAEFLELTKDCLDPDFYSLEDLPMLRASKMRWEEEQRRGKPTPAPKESGDWFDPWRSERE